MRDRESEPVEIVKIRIEVLIEAVVAALIFGAFMAILIIAATPAVPV